MGAALPHDNACNRRATFWARQAGTLVHAEVILEIPAAIHPIDAGSVTGDAIAQDGSDAGKETGGL